MTAAAAERFTANDAAPGPTNASTLLTVDDEPAVLGALRRLFRRGGYRVVQASSGAEALELLDEEPIDLVISDMRMPEMDGARLLELVRERRPDAARILLTGYADISSTIAAINRGEINRYVAKPWDDDELLGVVRDALARRELERRNAELTALTRRQNEQLQDANRTLESRVAARTVELNQVNGMLEAACKDLDSTFRLAVNVFSALLELREGNAGHARRVGALARATALGLGLSEIDVRDIELAALLHDVGKIAFPDPMFGRPVSSFTGEDMARYRKHPLDGEAALMPLTPLRSAARIVRQHHERLDGRGFPDGLSGSEIVLGAQVVAVASDYDAMLHGWAAEWRHSPEQARRALRGAAGSHYEARVVDAFMQVLAEADRAASTCREIDVRDLRPGMVLARDLVSARGAILLATGFVFDQRLVRQVNEFAGRERVRLTLFVNSEPVAASAVSR